MRRAAKVDANQAAIVEALRRVNVSVEVIGKPLDLLLCCRGETALGECKGEDGRFTKDQVEFIARWPGKVFIFKNPEQAVRDVLGAEAMA